METEDLTLHYCGERETIKEISEEFPYFRTPILSQTLVVKTIDLSNLPRFVVPSQDGDSVWMPHFEGNEERYGLHRVIPSIYIVPHEEVVRIRTLTPDPEQFRQVIELAMNITTDSHWTFHVVYIAILYQKLSRFIDEASHVGLRQRLTFIEAINPTCSRVHMIVNYDDIFMSLFFLSDSP